MKPLQSHVGQQTEVVFHHQTSAKPLMPITRELCGDAEHHMTVRFGEIEEDDMKYT